jgi:hypothetical protein
MRHKSFLFQVHRAYESKLDERCEFANAFLGSEIPWAGKAVMPRAQNMECESRRNFAAPLLGSGESGLVICVSR